MNPVQQRIALAELAGWKDIHGGPPHGTNWRGINPARPQGLMEEIPDYLRDLNAVHELEKLLNDRQAYYYRTVLNSLSVKHQGGGPINGSSGMDYHYPAPQRCEALLRAVGKWENGKEEML